MGTTSAPFSEAINCFCKTLFRFPTGLRPLACNAVFNSATLIFRMSRSGTTTASAAAGISASPSTGELIVIDQQQDLPRRVYDKVRERKKK